MSANISADAGLAARNEPISDAIRPRRSTARYGVGAHLVTPYGGFALDKYLGEAQDAGPAQRKVDDDYGEPEGDETRNVQPGDESSDGDECETATHQEQGENVTPDPINTPQETSETMKKEHDRVCSGIEKAASSDPIECLQDLQTQLILSEDHPEAPAEDTNCVLTFEPDTKVLSDYLLRQHIRPKKPFTVLQQRMGCTFSKLDSGTF